MVLEKFWYVSANDSYLVFLLVPVPAVKPVYESLQYEDSTEDMESEVPPAGTLPPLSSHSFQSADLIVKDPVPSGPNLPEGEAIDIALINSGKSIVQKREAMVIRVLPMHNSH